MLDAIALAKLFHETYERLAPKFGYETRKESAVPWEEVPANNRQLMIAVCQEIFPGSALAGHKEGAGGEPTIAQKLQGVVNKWLAEAERLHNLTPDERERDSRRNGLLEAVADVVAFTAEHDCGAQAPLPLQRTLPDEQFKGVVVGQSWAEIARDKAHAIVRMWLEDESGTSQEQRDRLVEDISDAILAAASPAGRAEQEQK